MRNDAIGLFWQDMPVIKAPKAEKEKRPPPEPTWLEPTYLPGLEEARAFNVPLYASVNELVASNERLVFDVESFENYFLIAFMGVDSGKVAYFEMQTDGAMDLRLLKWLLEAKTTVGFNSLNYDIPVLTLALAGHSTATMKEATNRIITDELRPWRFYKEYKLTEPTIDHIDLIEVAPLFASLKIYGGRLHTQRMQDLPFPHDALLSEDQISIVRWYCVNDLRNTLDLYRALVPQIELRERMSKEYNLDLRSKSDAQIAETVIAEEVRRLSGIRPRQPSIPPGTSYKYQVPNYVMFQTPLMQQVLETIRHCDFVVGESGRIIEPQPIKDLDVVINGRKYVMGIGGLHSTEKKSAHRASADTQLLEVDVAAYYPSIILNLGLYPAHLGTHFISTYRRIVERRLEAKRTKDKVTDDTLKIVINGSFGKFGSMFSSLYSPDLLIQVTVTGQLSLLMLIEALEINGVEVVSANTDGIVIKCHSSRKHIMENLVKQWETFTRFTVEKNEYRAIFSRDVNNYIAIKADGTTKTKGIFTDPGLSKNPVNSICVEAVEALLTTGTPIESTIRACTDIRKFISVRTARRGAVKVWADGFNEYLGNAIRWYYAEGEEGDIVCSKTGNRIATSLGAVPIMDLPREFPNNVNYDWYIAATEKMLTAIGYA